MSDAVRYKIDSRGLVIEHGDGSWVAWSDYQKLAYRLSSCLEGQEALKQQTVRIRHALTDDRNDGRDTEEIARTLALRLSSLQNGVRGYLNATELDDENSAAWYLLHGALANSSFVVERREIKS